MSTPSRLRLLLPVLGCLGFAGLLPADGKPSPAEPAAAHVVAVNQVGYETLAPKRFTAPLSADGSEYVVVQAGGSAVLFRGEIVGHIGDFSSFRPEDAAGEYVILVSGGGMDAGRSDPFAIRRSLAQEQFWLAAVDFMIDSRSIVGTHPSAYGGSPWRDGTYYDFAAPSLVLLYLTDPAHFADRPRQVDWDAERARVLSGDFPYDADNRGSEGALEAARRYFEELAPPVREAPDIVKLIHWGLGYTLFQPALRDISGDRLPRQVHGQTVEQFAYLLHQWEHFEPWLPESFRRRCHDFAFAHWRDSGLLDVPELWSPSSYLSESDLAENPRDKYLHPYKGRNAPGHSIQPNLLMYELALREGRADAADYLTAAQQQARWIIDHLDWAADPRVTKGQRMSEYKTITGLVWFLQRHPDHAPAGLREKIEDWATVAIARSGNLWDLRRYDLERNWSIPRLNEPGNLAAFAASALAASWVVSDAGVAHRLRELAAAHLDNLFGRNPRLAASPSHPEKGFPLVERGWPEKFEAGITARIELTRGAICSACGSEAYPYAPDAEFRHAEGWVAFNTAWNVALAYWQSDPVLHPGTRPSELVSP